MHEIQISIDVSWNTRRANHNEAAGLLSTINDWFAQNPQIKKNMRVVYLRPQHTSTYTKHKKYPFVRLTEQATVPKMITVSFESEADAVLFWLKFYTTKPFDFSWKKPTVVEVVPEDFDEELRRNG